MGARSGGKAKSAILGRVEPWANTIRKLFGSADALPTSCVRPRRIVSTTLQSHQLNLLVTTEFTDRKLPEIKDNSRNADELWPIWIVSCLFYLCLNRLKWADRSYYGVSCRIPRESWEKGWFIRKVHYPLFPTVLSRLSVIDDCVVFEETLGDLHGKKLRFLGFAARRSPWGTGSSIQELLKQIQPNILDERNVEKHQDQNSRNRFEIGWCVIAV